MNLHCPMLILIIGCAASAATGNDDDKKHFLSEEELEELLQSDHNRHKRGQGPSVVQRQRRHSADAADRPFHTHETSEEDSEGATEDSGPWGDWQPEAACSRSCGGGVFSESRTCKSPDQCAGPAKRFTSCNVDPCRGYARDFREEQCSKFNSALFEGKMHEWVPYLKAPRKCELNCMPRGERFYYRHARKVVDGTSCDLNDGVPRVCVNGECRPVGCDGMLGSDAKEDKCRVCGGDGSNCETAQGVIDKKDLTMGYDDLLLIPAGATNIRITESKASNNYLALRNSSGHYYLNGNWRIDFAGQYDFAGSTFHYERKHKAAAAGAGAKAAKAHRLMSMLAPEQIRALGPTTEQLFVVMLSQEQNPGIEFEYSLPSGAVAETPKGDDGYDWSSGSWGECDASCGGGFRVRAVFCALASSFERVPDYLCEGARKPIANETCNEQPCKPTWTTGPWSNCTNNASTAAATEDDKCPASSGVQVRNVFCQQTVSRGVNSVADETLCEEEGEEKPVAFKGCDEETGDDGEEGIPAYHSGPWSGCTALCGSGVRKRDVTCFKRQNDTTALLEDTECSALTKPAEEEECNAEERESCFPTGWIVSDWSVCGKEACGQLKQSRSALCADEKGSTYNETNCDEEKLPTLLRDCPKKEEEEEEEKSAEVCEPTWLAAQWSLCSSTCKGVKGVQTRLIFCASKDANNSFTMTEDADCDEARKYESEQPCEGETDCTGVWFAGAWGSCSAKDCENKGKKGRKIFCLKEGEPVAPDQCEVDKKPFEDEDCEKEECKEEEVVVEASGEEASGEGEEASGEETTTPKEEKKKEEEIKEGECKEYYDDFWIFGEGAPLGPKGNNTEDEEETTVAAADTEEEGSGEEEEGEESDVITAADLAGFEKRCKPEKPADCSNSTFGCCPDEYHAAEGPFGQGCEDLKTCEEARFGCCMDAATPANGTDFKGCPPSTCEETLFGCCSDGETKASGPDGQGCDENKLCTAGPFGCCPDGRTFSQGPKKQGCFTCPEGVYMCDSCDLTEFGCCVDRENAAKGPSFEGCPSKNDTGGYKDCTLAEHGCCPDGLTKAKGPDFKGCANATPCKDSRWGCCSDLLNPAHGPDQEGCCLTSKHGCCPDNVSPAMGPNQEGCECESTEFGCCPDDLTPARGPDFSGCGCVSTENGCCPDNFSPAEGPNFAGCPCHTHEYGCCPDGTSIARGPGQEGCSCKDTEFGCCPDRRTAASGPKGKGCGCAASKFGCCGDGEEEAEGEDFEGCESLPPVPPPDVCGLEKDRGDDRNFTTRWFYDTEYGGCSRFWYGGSGGNQNNFEEKEQCEEVCVEPTGRDACHLPIVPGPCEGHYPKFGYDPKANGCRQFVYGGCHGNNNKYDRREECEAVCAEDAEHVEDLTDKCKQPIKPGPCQGNFTRFGYNQETELCEEFTYGGCKGNRNAFADKEECVNSCEERGTSRDMCLLPRAQGPCQDKLPKWYFDNAEKRCMPFYYGGCEGNGNRFDSEDDCRRGCPAEFLQNDVCQMAQEVGPCRDFLERYHFDAASGTCRQFYFGGCEGNKNNFKSMQECQGRCSLDFGIPVEEDFKLEFCFMAKDEGMLPATEEAEEEGSEEGSQGGSNKTAKVTASKAKKLKRWHYDSSEGVCKAFDFGGRKGNGNRFLTRQSCETSCTPSQDKCELPKNVGPCDGRVEQYWYDKSKDACFTFDWGGCQGNTNRFATQEFCESACKRGGPGVVQRPEKVVGPQGSLVDICNLPMDKGPCEEKQGKYYFDSQSGKCTSFSYSGCEGNANRFESVEHCDRLCGQFRDQDVCSLEKEIGPCKGRFKKWHYDQEMHKCGEFTFGGCEGNGNRFSSQQECETVCLVNDEPLLSGNNTEFSRRVICNEPADPGPCQDNLKRWHFAPDRGTCVPFIYTGCAGNRNRFKAFKICMGFCEPALVDSSQNAPAGNDPGVPPPPPQWGGGRQPPGQDPRNPPQYPAVPPRQGEQQQQPPQQQQQHEEEPGIELPTYDKERCKPSDDRCQQAQSQCAYGPLRYFDDRSGCEECYCNEPCYGHECPADTKCAVELYKDASRKTNYRAVCRDETKSGVCPKLMSGNEYANCGEDCSDDSDCSGERKCCFNGCGRSCLEVVKDPGAEHLPAVEGDGVEPVPAGGDPNEPRIQVQQPTVVANEGSIVTLRVHVSGAPTPDVYWRKVRRDIDTRHGKYRIVEGGSLQIIGVDNSDEGLYTCLADNGRGLPADATVTLVVEAPIEIPAAIVETEDEVFLSLGASAVLHCLAYGYPKPSVTWWRGTEMLPMSSDRFEQSSDFSLRLKSVGLRDLGPYSCQAYNGKGSPASSTVVARAVGPVAPGSREEERYRQYVVDAPRAPEQQQQIGWQTPPPPGGVYRPTRPPGWDYQAPPPPSTAPPRPELGSLNVRVDMARTRFAIDSQISIPCTVSSFVKPTVFWSKNGQRIRPDRRVQILHSNNTLVIYNANPADSGSYTCEADNGYSRSSATTFITVENVYVAAECNDNPYFANCKLIVRAQYCANKYYAKFCCHSCTMAGQL